MKMYLAGNRLVDAGNRLVDYWLVIQGRMKMYLAGNRLVE